jgi:hypothetical protein
MADIIHFRLSSKQVRNLEAFRLRQEQPALCTGDPQCTDDMKH